MFFLAPASPTPLSPLYHKASSSPVHRSPCIAFCYTATAVQIRTKPFSIDQKQVNANLSLILYFFARTCSPLLLGTCLHPELKIIRTHIIKGCYLIVMTFFNGLYHPSSIIFCKASARWQFLATCALVHSVAALCTSRDTSPDSG